MSLNFLYSESTFSGRGWIRSLRNLAHFETPRYQNDSERDEKLQLDFSPNLSCPLYSTTLFRSP